MNTKMTWSSSQLLPKSAIVHPPPHSLLKIIRTHLSSLNITLNLSQNLPNLKFTTIYFTRPLIVKLGAVQNFIFIYNPIDNVLI